ncbi:MAG: hypothetical protein JWM60_1467 [Solirubrobacterales bacterium]|nr:hypothetical protein [Solirubrobacterales bacterium]
MAETLVDPAVSRAKLARQLADWDANAECYRKRGWVMLERGELHVEVGFMCALPIGPEGSVPAMPLAIRVGFENYDVWAPSVQLIDPVTRRCLDQPWIAGIDYERVHPGGVAEQVLVMPHPDTGKVFLCKRGSREYHSHPEHSGDDWLLYRGGGLGTLAQLCALLWRATTRTVVGLNFTVQRVPVPGGVALMTAAQFTRAEPQALSVAVADQAQPSAGGSGEVESGARANLAA